MPFASPILTGNLAAVDQDVGPDDQIDDGLPLDIFVQFGGTPPGTVPGDPDPEEADKFDKAFNTDAYKRAHKPAATVCFFGGRGAADPSGQAAQKVLDL